LGGCDWRIPGVADGFRRDTLVGNRIYLARKFPGWALFDPDSRPNRRWREHLEQFAIPYDAGEFPLVKFLSADVGWAGTVADGQIVFFRTTDGGKTWEKSVTVTQKRGTQLRDLFFLNKDRGWLIVDYNLKEGFNGNGTYVLATNDGGKTWTAQTSDVLQNAFAWHVSFLSERLGFLFVTAPISSRDSAEMTPAILYTQDLGLHWHKVNVANEVSACQALDGDLLCGANTKGSQPGLLRIHPR
jgi:photosystem II stability/assembly factor-like uncharacterized protein